MVLSPTLVQAIVGPVFILAAVVSVAVMAAREFMQVEQDLQVMVAAVVVDF
jgi:hypothetical protein